MLTVALVRHLDNVGAQTAMLSLWNSAWPRIEAPLGLYFAILNTPARLVHIIPNPTSGGQTDPIQASLVSRGTRDAYPRKRRPRSGQPPLYL